MDGKKKFEELTDLDLLKCFAWQSKKMNCSMIHYICNEYKVNHNPIDIKPLEERADSGIKHGLAGLPMEIHLNIMLRLDIQTLGRIRHANSHLRNIVDGIPEYRRVRKYAYDTTRAMRDTTTILYHPLKKVYQVLTRGACEVCGKFGPFVSPLTLERCCFDCLVDGCNPHLNVVGGLPKRLLHISQNGEQQLLPTLLPLVDGQSMICPDICYNCNTSEKRKLTRYSEGHTRMFSRSAMEAVYLECRLFNHRYVCHLVGAVRMPVLDNDHRRVEHGIMCGGCKPWRDDSMYVKLRTLGPTSRVSRRAWTIETFLEHVKTCRGARQQWDGLSLRLLEQFLNKDCKLLGLSFIQETAPEQDNLDEYSGWSKNRPFRVFH
jgi:hypothetical protein